jgi:hypothetical protein
MRFGLLIFLCLLTSCASSGRSPASIEYSPDLFSGVPFLENKTHLAMNIHFSPVENIRLKVEEKEGALKNRGEAHITVITPMEYQILKEKIQMPEINYQAQLGKIQQARFKPLCVGRGRMQIDGQPESTYFIVVESTDLLKLREKISEVYISRGGDSAKFKPEIYYPHITLGFTKRDLHIEEGIYKDISSCIESLDPKVQ